MTVVSQELARKAANTIRLLAADGVQKANSGHPGMPMGMADCAFVLWNRFLNFNPQDPTWPNRDRFVLSAGHGSMLLYAMLHLSGYDVTMDDLQNFRQWGSRTPGHPEVGCLPGVETTTGPLGQGFANGVGMAIAARMTAARFNQPGFDLFGKHHIFAIVSDGDLMEGVSAEAASIAGHLKLGNIIYLYDDNQITIEGNTQITFTESVEQRFAAYGWHTTTVDGYDHEAIARALQAGIDESGRPTLIITKSHIGYGSPNKQDTPGVHGSPLGDEELARTKEKLGFNQDAAFVIDEDVRELFRQRNAELEKRYATWQEKFEGWCKAFPQQYDLFRRMQDREIPADLAQQLIAALPGKDNATRSTSGVIMQKLAELVPELVGGSADLEPSTKTYLKSSNSITAGDFSGRNFHFGIREHAMGSIMNGMALYGGFIPYGATFLVFSDYMRPAIRLAALSAQQCIYVFTHDSIFVGEDGPTHQPVEHVAALRCMPNVTVLRPADGLETAVCWAMAVEKKNGPTALILTRQKVPELQRPDHVAETHVRRGAYVLAEASDGRTDVVLIASGSEVQFALQARNLLQEKGIGCRVVSMPCREIFNAQPEDYQRSVIPEQARCLTVVEAGVSFGWTSYFNLPMQVLGIDRFGASAPYKVLEEKFGFTGEGIAVRVMDFLKKISE